MYHQVLIDSHDGKFQFLWKNAEELQTYQLNTVIYGMSAVPYLASLHLLDDQYMYQLEIGAHVIKKVDDFLGGAYTLNKLAHIKSEVKDFLNHSCFQLDNWHFNQIDF